MAAAGRPPGQAAGRLRASERRWQELLPKEAFAAVGRATSGAGRFHAAVVGAVLACAALAVLLDPGVASAGGVGGEHVRAGALVGLVCAAVIALQYAVAAMEALSRSGAQLNVQRKVQHIASGLAIAQLFRVLPLRTSQLALGAAVAAFSLVQGARGCSQEVNAQFLAMFGPMLKDEERSAHRAPAALQFLLGCLLCVLAFPRQLAIFCILVATVADPLAAVAGLLFGGPKLLKKKSLGGSAACCLAGALLAAAMLPPDGGLRGALADAGTRSAAWLLCGLAAAVGELAGGVWWWLDDNLTSSFGSGLLLLAARRALDAAGVGGLLPRVLAELLV